MSEKMSEKKVELKYDKEEDEFVGMNEESRFWIKINEVVERLNEAGWADEFKGLDVTITITEKQDG